jgi:hypothetical protein
VHHHTHLYHRRRQELFRRLGDRCACGSTEKLAVDHVDGVTWTPRELSSHERVRRYLAEFDAGVRLRLLCIACDPDRSRGKGRLCSGAENGYGTRSPKKASKYRSAEGLRCSAL